MIDLNNLPLPDEAYLPEGATTLDAVIDPPRECEEAHANVPGVSVHPKYLYSPLFARRCTEAHDALQNLLGEGMASSVDDVLACSILLSQLSVATPEFTLAMFRDPASVFSPHPVRTMGVSADTMVYHPDLVLWCIGRRNEARDDNDFTDRYKRFRSIAIHEAKHYADGDLLIEYGFPTLFRNDQPKVAKFARFLANLVLDAIHDRSLAETSRNVAPLHADFFRCHARFAAGALASTLAQLQLDDGTRQDVVRFLSDLDEPDTMTKAVGCARVFNYLAEHLTHEEPQDGEGGDGEEGAGDSLPDTDNSDGGEGHLVSGVSEPGGQSDATHQPESAQERADAKANAEAMIDTNLASTASQCAGMEAGVLDLKHRVARTQREVDWRQVLSESMLAVTAGAGDRSSLRRCRAEPALSRVYLPSRYAPQVECAALLDVSGSMVWAGGGIGELIYALTTIVTGAGGSSLAIVPFDTDTYPTLVVDQNNATGHVFDMGGGGGTSLDKPLQEMRRRMDVGEIPKLDGAGTLIIGTDCYVQVPNPRLIRDINPQRVVWVSPENNCSETVARAVTSGSYATATGVPATHLKIK